MNLFWYCAKLLVRYAVSFADIEIVEQLLFLFWRLMEKYHGNGCFAAYNVNLSKGSVCNQFQVWTTAQWMCIFFLQLYGPLWTHSAFVLEDGIWHLLKMAHGTHDVRTQVDTKWWWLHIVDIKLHFLSTQIVTAYLLKQRMSVQRSKLEKRNRFPAELKDI